MNSSSKTILRRAGPLAAVVAALAMAWIPSASSQTGGPQYPDASGDSGAAADITGVTVLGDKASGQMIFQIAATNAEAANQVIELDIDSDANPATGDSQSNGADYAFQVHPSDHQYGFWHWNGSDWVDTSYATVRVMSASNGVTISVNKSEIGGASDVKSAVYTFIHDGTDPTAFDRAPDDGMFNYSIDAGGPDIQSVMLQTTPSFGPKAGKSFIVLPVGLKLPPDGSIISVGPHPESYTCKATLRGRALAGTGTGGCTLRVPKKKARGKKLNVVVTVTYEGATKSFPFTFAVS